MLIKEGKTNIKYILIIVILAAVVGGGTLWCVSKQEVPVTQFPEIKIPKDETADWKIAKPPSVLTLETLPNDIDFNQAKVKGKLTDLGGAYSVDVWFVWDTNYYDDWQDYTYDNAANKETMIQTGEFEYTIESDIRSWHGSLFSATLYHFRVIASNAAGIAFSDDKIFTTLSLPYINF